MCPIQCCFPALAPSYFSFYSFWFSGVPMTSLTAAWVSITSHCECHWWSERPWRALCAQVCSRALCSCLLEELTRPCLPMFLLPMAVSQWVGQTPCGSVSRVGWELLGDSGTVGLSSLVFQPADLSQAGKQVVIMWWGMTEGRTLPSSHSHLLFACHQTAAVRNSHQLWEVNVGPS